MKTLWKVFWEVAEYERDAHMAEDFARQRRRRVGGGVAKLLKAGAVAGHREKLRRLFRQADQSDLPRRYHEKQLARELPPLGDSPYGRALAEVAREISLWALHRQDFLRRPVFGGC